MPEGLTAVVLLLAFGYLLLFLELFMPGGVLGVIGTASVLYACYLAFGLSTGWGIIALSLSLVVALVAIRLFTRSRVGKSLMLVGDQGAKGWRANEAGLDALLGQEGKTLTPLRPAGRVEIGDRRVDVVADSEFLAAGVRVRVCEVEGNRVLVEAVESETQTEAEAGAEAVEPPDDAEAGGDEAAATEEA
ncbi:MAG: NfeD family protein [Thermoanaerobaculia bacterium]